MMPKTKWTVWLVLLTASALWAQSPEAPTPAPAPKAAPPKAAPANVKGKKSHSKKPPKVAKKVVLPALPGGPLRQLPMDQIPSTPATVTYKGGMLSISAQNSPLGEILREVRKLTGAAIEMPPHATASDERVITHLGPGTPRDVLVALLNGSSFNYVMLGSNSDPAVISNIILTDKTPGADAQTVANVSPGVASPGVVMPPHPIPAPQAFNPQNGQPVQPGNGEAEENKEDEPENAVDENANSDEPAQPVQNGQVDNNGGQDPNQPNAGPKTPEQILEMLRRQQQQQPPPGGPPPQ
jgi:hypothetical protein